MATTTVHKQMLINYVPGEECRVAILEGGRLEEYHAERPATANRVGNLYLARVTNVESSIQAAFVDFGGPENAFLHTSDLHPRYFPGEDEETSEKIGKKTPRRERPPIQKCLKKGQLVVVQIMKDGVGTKGPACTSYLSIPGRYLVMMPFMDNVGVSRKVDDEETRKKMRAILDQLELPEGFGFILRTAGFDKTKTELKRDQQYLQRLWKDIERRQKKAKKPALLYAESDLLVRALRDLLAKDVDEIIVDNEQGLMRAANFLKVVAPRTASRLLHYDKPTPMFHAYGLEDQLKLMISREVPLPSGGRLVIDETEAVVAIDVNSGKSRRASDAESNAYQTNLEAVDEICRQIKLRELGGVVINDLIDMGSAKHRKEIEQRFRDRLKNDRAKSTILPISEFGILEMTRQRARQSAMSQHFQELPASFGRGWVRKADSVASEALREVMLVLSAPGVNKAELIVPGRVAGELLSHRRRSILRMELTTGKHIDVRVSEALGSDRYTIYAYDEAGNDVDLAKLPKPRPPAELPVWEIGAATELEDIDDTRAMLDVVTQDVEAHPIELLSAEPEPDEDDEDERDGSAGGKKKRRRRRRGKKAPADGGELASSADQPAEVPGIRVEHDGGDADAGQDAGARADESDDEHTGDSGGDSGGEGEGQGGGKKRRRRRRGRRRGGGGDGMGEDAGPAGSGEHDPAGAEGEGETSGDDTDEDGDSGSGSPDSGQGQPGEGGGKKRRRRRRGRRRGEGEDAAQAGSRPEGRTESRPESRPGSRPQPSSTPSVPAPAGPTAGPSAGPSAGPPAPAVKKPKLLYAASRRKLKPSERVGGDE
jgi:ribonuclease E